MARELLPITTVQGHTFLPGLLRKTSTVVDLGGNLGEFSIAMQARFGCTCYVVEPVPALYERIPQNPHIIKFNAAVAKSSQPLRFFLSEEITAGSLHKSGVSSDAEIEVQGISLTDFLTQNNIESVDLLKIDIEGAERDLFDDVSNETLRRIKQITIEFHDFIPGVMTTQDVDRVKQRLADAGFYCIQWSMTSNYNVMFVRKDLLSSAKLFYITHCIRYYSKLANRVTGA
jgi:FkbM family methyltransferase